ncbi:MULTISPECIES: hypothetical protein [unclassified Eikenella]|uniref:hypothetical protein n=1 Tax=unclassified Eikenella TaxID=2639367 RepID=UPI00143BB10B|nr:MULTISPECIES: hypothetical protein [unclassified Eikenella]
MPPDPNNGNHHNRSNNIKERHREYAERAANDMRANSSQFEKGTTRNSSTQIFANISQEEAVINLERNGFSRHATIQPNVYFFEKGGVRYNFYPKSTGGGMRNVKTGLPSAEMIIDGKRVGVKIRFGIIK